MARARVIIKRRKAVRNIKKITKVMQMIASARYAKALRRAVGTRPYTQKIAELVASVAESVKTSGKEIDHPLLRQRTVKSDKIGVLVVSSNRGLAGGYNGGILRAAMVAIREVEAAGDTPQLYISGKKGIAYFKFLRRPMAQQYSHISDAPKYADVEVLANQFIQDYIDGKIDGLKVVYQRFITAGQQKPTVVDILPLNKLADAPTLKPGEAPAKPIVYEFSPSPTELLNELIPVTVKLSIFQAFIDAAVSEQIARMVAMKAATDNADKMGKKLTQDYNRARQSQITSELSELMGGVEAMK
jgi:F-type H+-transporting ATPase subunit gamma